jgi:hypothetical protein
LVSAEDDRITHLMLRRHLLRAPRVVTLPVGAIERLDTDATSLRLTRREVDLR